MNLIYSVDVETDQNYKPFCISFTDQALYTKYFRWDDEKPPKIVNDVLEDTSITKVYHNAKFDIKWCASIGLNTFGKIHDTLILAKIGLPFEPSYGLKALAKKYLDEPCELEQQVKEWLRKNKDKGYHEIPPKLLKEYNMEDTRITMKLFYYLKEILGDKIYKLEIALLYPIINMETSGIRVDIKKTRELTEKYENTVDKIREYFKNKRGLDNLNSPKQVSDLLYSELKLDLPFWKGKTHRSTDSLALLLLQRKYPNLKDLKYILNYREKYTKIKMFLKPFLTTEKEGYLYPQFNQMGDIDRRRIKTGRFSSSNPNFQNIPRGNEIRQLIIPRKGYYFLDLDYSQIEMRLYAFMAEDKLMINAFYNGEDLHNKHKEIFVDPFKKDDGKNRQIAKSIGFEMLYGIGAPGMTKYLNKMKIFVDQEVIRKMIYNWHEIHPSLTQFKRILYRELRRNGFIEDYYGRRYYLPLAKSYMAVNYAIQGMSANIMKDVLPEIDEYVNMKGGNMLLTIHDEVLLELPIKAMNNGTTNRIKALMEAPGKKLNIPLEVTHQVLLNNWGEKT